MKQILPRDFSAQSRMMHMARMRGIQERTDEIAVPKIFAQVDGHVILMFEITHDTFATELIRDIQFYRKKNANDTERFRGV